MISPAWAIAALAASANAFAPHRAPDSPTPPKKLVHEDMVREDDWTIRMVGATDQSAHRVGHGHFGFVKNVPHDAVTQQFIDIHQAPHGSAKLVDTVEDEVPPFKTTYFCECPEQTLKFLKRECAMDTCKALKPKICENLEIDFKAALASTCKAGKCSDLEILMDDWVAHRPESRAQLFMPHSGHHLRRDEGGDAGKDTEDHPMKWSCENQYDDWHWNRWMGELHEERLQGGKGCGLAVRGYSNGFPTEGMGFCGEDDHASEQLYDPSKVDVEAPYTEMYTPEEIEEKHMDDDKFQKEHMNAQSAIVK